MNEPQPQTPAGGELARLRNFTGKPAEFWPAFLATAGALIGARRGVLVLQEPGQPNQWKKLGDWTDNGHADRATVAFNQALLSIAERCAQEGGLVQRIEGATVAGGNNVAVATRLELLQADHIAVAVFLVLNAADETAREALIRLQLVADVPASYQQTSIARQSRGEVEKFASALDLMVLVNAEKRFLAAALALCNALATRFGCERVSLGWLEHGYVKLKALSRTERFDRKMAAAQALERVMEEGMDQDEDVVWPLPENSPILAKDHQDFAREQKVENICSLPMRCDNKPVGSVTCERQARPFSEAEVMQIRLAIDQAVRRLADLHHLDRWFGARWAATAREKLGHWLGPEKTWTKVLVMLGTALLIVSLLPIWPYRIEGNFVLRSDELVFLTSPFDGYISRVSIRPGDQVKRDMEILQLHTIDLELEEAAAAADLNRYNREAEKARAANTLADMRIALALAEQVRARLELVRHRLQQSTIKSPIDGVLVEGDLRQRIGAPVKQGDILFKVGRMETLYVEAEVHERDIHRLRESGRGEIAFVSQPKQKHAVRIVRIEPAAMPKNNANVFIVRCAFDQPVAGWWRPGMSGLAKIDVDQRSLLWIATHRTVDFLRMWLWW